MPFGGNYIGSSVFLNQLMNGILEAQKEDFERQLAKEELNLKKKQLELEEKRNRYKTLLGSPGQAPIIADVEEGTFTKGPMIPYAPKFGKVTDIATDDGIRRGVVVSDPNTGRVRFEDIGLTPPDPDLLKAKLDIDRKKFEDYRKRFNDIFKQFQSSFGDKFQFLANPDTLLNMLTAGKVPSKFDVFLENLLNTGNRAIIEEANTLLKNIMKYTSGIENPITPIDVWLRVQEIKEKDLFGGDRKRKQPTSLKVNAMISKLVKRYGKITSTDRIKKALKVLVDSGVSKEEALRIIEDKLRSKASGR